MSGLKTLLNREGENGLYPFFWQRGDSHDVLREYVDKIHECGISGFCIEARPHPDFTGEQWFADLDVILAKAKEHGMKMWILDDSHFPTGYANGLVKKKYPEYLKKYLYFRRYDIQGPFKHARIDLKHLAGRIWDEPDPSWKVLNVVMAKRVVNEEDDPIDVSTLRNITSFMDQDSRLLTIDVDEGPYSIFVVFETRQGGEALTADYINPLVKEATEVLVEACYQPHYDHFRDEFGKTIQGFFSDEPRFGNAKGVDCGIGKDMPLPWCDHLEEELGFDPLYLALLWANGQGAEHDIRYRYMDVITKKYNENFTRVLADWCHDHGVWYLGHNIEDNGAHSRLGYGTGHYFRGQEDMDFAGIDVIGGQIVPGMNYHHDAFSTGGSNGEFYHYALAKLAASAAHLDPKKKGRIMCEAFGAYGWNEGLRTMKWIADSLISRGVNHIVPHAFSPGEFPDYDCPPHFYAHGHNPQYRYLHLLNGYMNRIMSLQKGGFYPSRVGVFYPAEEEWSGACMPIEKPCRELTQAQISYDIVTLDYLNKAVIKDGSYAINDHPFEVLLIPYGENIPCSLKDKVNELLENSVRVIFLNALPVRTVAPIGECGLHTNVEVASLNGLADVLDGYSCVRLSEETKDLVAGEYCLDDKHLYFLFNESVSKTIDVKSRFSAEGNLYRYDPWTDRLYFMKNGDVRIHLTPYEMMIYVFSKEQYEAEVFEKEVLLEETELPKKWKVSFADSFAYPSFKQLDTDRLDYVDTLKGMEDKCGTVRYETKIHVSDTKEVVLDLGNAHEIAEVFVNGVSSGVRICRPYEFNLSGLLKNGENDLAIEVTNSLGTQVRDAISHYLPIEPFGIEGPVKMEIKKHDQ